MGKRRLAPCLFPRSARVLLISAVLFSTGIVGSSTSRAAITFTFDFSTNDAGVGFLDAAEGSTRQTALATAGNLFSNLFGNHFTNSGSLTFLVTSTDDANSTTLASAGSNFVQATGFGAGEVVRNKLLAGNDLNGSTADGFVDVNWGVAWELDPNVPAVGPGVGENFDFYATVFHEFTHALGFGSELSASSNTDRFGNGGEGSGTAGSWSKWDEFLTAMNGESLVNMIEGTINEAAFVSAQTTGGLFAGPNAILAFGEAPQLFANPDQSHLDEATFSIPNMAQNFMMKPNRDFGPLEARTWSGLEVGILTDLGFSPVTAIPEPSSFAVIIVGVFAVVARRRHMKSKAI